MKTKALILNNVLENLNILILEYHLKSKKIKVDYDLLEKYLKIAKSSHINVSYANFESAIAVAYMLRTYGIPIKSSSKILKVDSKKIFKLIKLIDKDILKSDNYKNFIEFLLKNDSEEFRTKFITLYDNMISNFPDRMLLAISLFGILKKKEKGDYFMFKENLYGYSEFTVRQKRQEIINILNNKVV
ncbi:MAG: hypothetical protein ACYCS1_04330 [Gammaproteobacteria bacterium]